MYLILLDWFLICSEAGATVTPRSADVIVGSSVRFECGLNEHKDDESLFAWLPPTGNSISPSDHR